LNQKKTGIKKMGVTVRRGAVKSFWVLSVNQDDLHAPCGIPGAAGCVAPGKGVLYAGFGTYVDNRHQGNAQVPIIRLPLNNTGFFSFISIIVCNHLVNGDNMPLITDKIKANAEKCKKCPV
jgi:hypothetical protein